MKKDFKKKDIFIVIAFAAIFLFIVFIISSLTSPTKDEKLCGDKVVTDLIQKQAKGFLKDNIKRKYNILLLTTLFDKDKKEKEIYKKKEKELLLTVDKFVKNMSFSNFKIIKHDKDYKHLLCKATIHSVNSKGLPTDMNLTYYVKHFTKKNGEDWFQADLEKMKMADE